MLIASDEFKTWSGDNFDRFMSIATEIVKDLDLGSLYIFLKVDETCRDALATSVLPKGKIHSSCYNVVFNSDAPMKDIYNFAFIMAHELRHVFQYRHGMISNHSVHFHDNDGNIAMSAIIWKNVVIKVPPMYHPHDHYDLPFEKDSNQYAKKFARKYRNEMNYEVNDLWSKIVASISYFSLIHGYDYDLKKHKFNDLDWKSLKQTANHFTALGYENFEI